MFSVAEIPRRQSDPSLSCPKNNTFWVYVWCRWHQNDWPKKKTCWGQRFRWCIQNHYFKIFGRAVWNFGYQNVPFPGWKFEKIARDFFSVWQWSKVNQLMQKHWKIRTITVFVFECKSNYLQQTAPCLFSFARLPFSKMYKVAYRMQKIFTAHSIVHRHLEWLYTAKLLPLTRWTTTNKLWALWLRNNGRGLLICNDVVILYLQIGWLNPEAGRVKKGSPG